MLVTRATSRSVTGRSCGKQVGRYLNRLPKERVVREIQDPPFPGRGPAGASPDNGGNYSCCIKALGQECEGYTAHHPKTFRDVQERPLRYENSEKALGISTQICSAHPPMSTAVQWQPALVGRCGRFTRESSLRSNLFTDFFNRCILPRQSRTGRWTDRYQACTPSSSLYAKR